MGAWGAGIFDDDTALDVRGIFEESLAEGSTPVRATELALEEFGECLEDPDDGPVVVLAIASLLLERGVANHPIQAAAIDLLKSGEGLERWAEAGPESLAERRAVYADLLGKLQSAGAG